MKKQSGYPHNVKRGSVLWWIGFWATAWWGASCVYVLLVVWIAKDFYIEGQSWVDAKQAAFAEHTYLYWLLAFILVGWLVAAVLWFKELKKQKVSYKVALKDLFLTIRK